MHIITHHHEHLRKFLIQKISSSYVISLVFLLAILLAGCSQVEHLNESPLESDLPTDGIPTLSISPSPQKTPTPFFTPIQTFNLSSVQNWGDAQAIFDITERSFGKKEYLGIFKLDFNSGILTEISGKGTQLLDLSPDFQNLLVSQEQNLFIINKEGQQLELLADDYFSASPQGAQWVNSSGEILYISSDGVLTSLQSVQAGSGTKKELTSDNPISIHSSDSNIVVWGKGVCNTFGNCTHAGITWIDFQGNELEYQELGEAMLLPCQTTSDFVYAKKNEENVLSFNIHSINSQSLIKFWSTNTEYSDCAWSPDQEQIVLIIIDRGWYSGTIQDYYQQILIPEKERTYTLPASLGTTGNASWAPDGKYILFTGTDIVNTQYQIVMRLFDTETYSVTKMDEYIKLGSENYISINRIFWLP